MQGYTNKGIIMGDWIGREAKGGQAWLTYHLRQRVGAGGIYEQEDAEGFHSGRHDAEPVQGDVVKRFGGSVEMKSWVQYEGWKAPIYKPGLQKNVTTAVQFTWYPQLHQ